MIKLLAIDMDGTCLDQRSRMTDRTLDVLRKAAIVGGNWNNDLQCGPFYANLNNTPSNSNSNNGAALSYPIRSFSLNAVHIAVKNSKRQFVSSSPLGEN